MQPMAVSRNKMMNKPSSTVRDVLQPVRDNRSANSMETRPVSNTAEEKNRNSRQPRRRCGAGTASRVGGWSAMDQRVQRDDFQFLHPKGFQKFLPRRSRN